MIGGALIYNRYQFAAVSDLQSMDGVISRVEFAHAGSGYVDLVDEQGENHRYQFGWSVNDIFRDIKIGGDYSMLHDAGWIVAVSKDGEPVLEYSNYVNRRNRELYIILWFAAGLALILSTVLAVRLAGFRRQANRT